MKNQRRWKRFIATLCRTFTFTVACLGMLGTSKALATSGYIELAKNEHFMGVADYKILVSRPDGVRIFDINTKKTQFITRRFGQEFINTSHGLYSISTDNWVRPVISDYSFAYLLPNDLKSNRPYLAGFSQDSEYFIYVSVPKEQKNESCMTTLGYAAGQPKPLWRKSSCDRNGIKWAGTFILAESIGSHTFDCIRFCTEYFSLSNGELVNPPQNQIDKLEKLEVLTSIAFPVGCKHMPSIPEISQLPNQKILKTPTLEFRYVMDYGECPDGTQVYRSSIGPKNSGDEFDLRSRDVVIYSSGGKK
ncbi:hypothetical protein Dxin01_03803 [Deinococcus xinjiangensis]|uniref:Uncharacterized protein n=1 Tax=Deinococcus xinjiangensis TaxID=457454 RepID=A0ABP9VID5_9DEIO